VQFSKTNVIVLEQTLLEALGSVSDLHVTDPAIRPGSIGGFSAALSVSVHGDALLDSYVPTPDASRVTWTLDVPDEVTRPVTDTLETVSCVTESDTP
jgi:hypothetical protein